MPRKKADVINIDRNTIANLTPAEAAALLKKHNLNSSCATVSELYVRLYLLSILGERYNEKVKKLSEL
jgi:hypothetical protein